MSFMFHYSLMNDIKVYKTETRSYLQFPVNFLICAEMLARGLQTRMFVTEPGTCGG